MELRHNIRQTIHYHPVENNSALGIIKIGLLQVKFCWVLDKIQNLGKFRSGVHSVNTYCVRIVVQGSCLLYGWKERHHQFTHNSVAAVQNNIIVAEFYHTIVHHYLS